MRKLTKTKGPNDGTRSLFESALSDQIVSALRDWSRVDATAVLIGGMALSYHGRPRTTDDIDFLFLSAQDIPDKATGFKRTRPHAFLHLNTHVEVELVTPELVNLPPETVKAVFSTAVIDGTIKIASKSALVALKLFRFSRQDQADIDQLIRLGDINISGFGLTQAQIDKYLALVADVANDPVGHAHPPGS